jgi:hypothetical protein
LNQYKTKPGGFKEIQKQLLVRTLPVMIIAIGGAIAIGSINSKDKAGDINTLPIFIPLIVASVGFGLYRGLKRQKAIFESYTLTLNDNLITRDQLNTPGISIYFNQIKEIAKNKKGGLSIKGKNATDLIIVPAQIENYDRLESVLSQIKSIETKSNEPILEKYRVLFFLLIIGLMLCVYTVTNKIVVAITGTLLIGIMVWSFYEGRRSKNIDAKTKRGMLWIVLVLASVILVMVFKLIGVQKK